MADRIWIGTDTGNEGDWATAANWTGAAVPVNGDDVYFVDSSQSVTEGFAQGAVTLGSLNIAQSYTGLIGTAAGYLVINATVLRIGYHYGPGTPAGSGRIKLNLGAAASTAIIFNTGSPDDSYLPAVRLLCNHANTTVEVRKGTVGIACEPTETSTLSKVSVSYVSQVTADADVYIGAGVTLTTLDKSGGDCVLECAATTVTNGAGKLITAGSGAITTMNCTGGTIESNSSGTITTCNAFDAGYIDFTKAQAARTVTTLKIGNSARISLDPSIITLTNKIQPYDASGDVTLQAA